MSSFDKAERTKIFALEESVINDSPEEVARVYKELGEVAFTARALGLACRFRDLETVKVLVEGGASFKYDELAFRGSYQYFFIEYFHGYYPDFQNFLVKDIILTSEYTVTFYVEELVKNRDDKPLPLAPDSERVKIVDYLCGCAESIGFEPRDLLYYLIVTDDRKMISALKQNGVTLSENKRKMLTEKGGALLRIPKSDNELMRIISELRSEVGGEKLHITSSMLCGIERRFSNPELFRFFLENFDMSNIRKGSLLERFVLSENVSCLEIAAGLGWIKTPKKREELIALAAEKGKTECTAFLLDFKNRTADLNAERARAEKKAERELLAAPDSVTVLKQFWNYKKLEDGSVIITGYKGDRTEIIVPAKIGKSEVKVIGEMAFSLLAPRISRETKEFRKAITKITLPETVEKICEQAFTLCKSLETVIVSEGVTEIGFHAFFRCPKLERVELPRSLEKVDDVMPDSGLTMFDQSPNVTAVVYPKTYAEEYCKRNNIPFVYKED